MTSEEIAAEYNAALLKSFRDRDELLETLRAVKVALNEGVIIGDPALLFNGGFPKFVDILNKVSSALAKHNWSQG